MRVVTSEAATDAPLLDPVGHGAIALRPSVLHVRDAAKAARTLLGDRQGL